MARWWWRIIGFFAIGAPAAGFAAAAGAAGFIGAFWAQAGAAIAKAAAIAIPVRRCFMPIVLCGSSGFDDTLQILALPDGQAQNGPVA